MAGYGYDHDFVMQRHLRLTEMLEQYNMHTVCGTNRAVSAKFCRTAVSWKRPEQ